MDKVSAPQAPWPVREQFPPDTTPDQVQAVAAFIAGVARLLVARWETEGHVNYPALQGGACASSWVDQGKR